MFNMIFVFLISSGSAHGFFGFEAETTQGYKMAEGLITGSVLVDDISASAEDGFSNKEIEDLLVQKSKSAAKFKGKSEAVAAEYEKIRFMDEYNTRSSATTKALKRTMALYTTLCAYSPESCNVAATHIGNKKTDDTNVKLDTLITLKTKENLKKEIKDQEETNQKIDELEAVNKIPLQILRIVEKRLGGR